jgi:hypothetical protein
MIRFLPIHMGIKYSIFSTYLLSYYLNTIFFIEKNYQTHNWLSNFYVEYEYPPLYNTHTHTHTHTHIYIYIYIKAIASTIIFHI